MIPFWVSGRTNSECIDSLYLYQDEITHVLAAHEQDAAHAADWLCQNRRKSGCGYLRLMPGCNKSGMKYSLVRDLLADSTETMALAHGFDGLVMEPNCDKKVPGLLMAAARVKSAHGIRKWRPYAGRPCGRQKDQPFQHV